MPDPIALSFEVARDEDFPYIYRLCEATMRPYVEADLGDCFEKVARLTIQKLVQGGKFYKIHANAELVGAVAHGRHETHIQLEELYLEPVKQNQGLGAEIMGQFIEQSRSLELPSGCMSWHQILREGSMSDWASPSLGRHAR